MLLQDLVCFSQSCSNYVVCQSWDLLEFLYTKYPSSHFIYFNLNVASLCCCLYIFNFLMSIYLIAKIKQNKYLNSPVFGSWAHVRCSDVSAIKVMILLPEKLQARDSGNDFRVPNLASVFGHFRLNFLNFSSVASKVVSTILI